MQGVVVHVTGGAISKEESDAYVARGREKYGRALERVDVKLDGEYAKRAEERDRVKHSMEA